MTIDEFMRDIAPKMKPGWVAMDKDRTWSYFPYEPRIIDVSWWGNDYETSLSMFDIDPVDDWTKSLREVGCETDREIELEKDIDRLSDRNAKLEIAVKALEFYAIPLSQLSPVYNIAQHHRRAEKTLEEINDD